MSSLSLVRHRTSYYSVPVAYGKCDFIARDYGDRVVISCGSEVTATHTSSYEKDG